MNRKEQDHRGRPANPRPHNGPLRRASGSLQLKMHPANPLPSLDGNLYFPTTRLRQLKNGRPQEFICCRIARGSEAHRQDGLVTRAELDGNSGLGDWHTCDGILDKHADVDWACSKRGRCSEHADLQTVLASR
jgi:hypothetical protein